MYIHTQGLSDITNWKDILDNYGTQSSLKSFVADIKTLSLSNSVLVDCTASDEVTDYYEELQLFGVHIVAANKRATSGKYQKYLTLTQNSRNHGKFLYETNVGAGLPVIGTLKNIRLTGDKIEKVEAVLSGTLSFVFNSFVTGTTFSEIVKMAQQKGYTEPGK